MGNEIKQSLELKKLELEIAELERPFWKRPAYVLAALPTLLAVVALSVGFVNGFFSAQLTKLENQRHDVEAQVREFEAKRDELHKQNEALANENKALADETKALSDNLVASNQKLDALMAVVRPQISRRDVVKILGYTRLAPYSLR